MGSELDKRKLDVSQIFLTFMALVGDVEKTAAALDMDVSVVEALAKAEGWDEKIRRISMLSKSDKPGDWERAQNRALNFVQAHRLRAIVTAMLNVFQDLTPEEICEKLSTIDKLGHPHISARFLADLAAAAEKTHALSYAALGDSVKERTSRLEEEGGGMSADQIHLAVINALNNPAVASAPKQLLASEVAPFEQGEQKATPADSAQVERKSPGPSVSGGEGVANDIA